MNVSEKMSEGLEALKQDIVSKYKMFVTNQLSTDCGGERVKAFEEGLSISVGHKYVKIMSNGSVWGFVVNTESDKKFSLGDILYPAGWGTPTRNKARGNVITQEWGVSWTGPNYLK
jgi:hypothetical protein